MRGTRLVLRAQLGVVAIAYCAERSSELRTQWRATWLMVKGKLTRIVAEVCRQSPRLTPPIRIGPLSIAASLKTIAQEIGVLKLLDVMDLDMHRKSPIVVL
jgi:16S rRNA U1498 N3-methylase RsmE